MLYRNVDVVIAGTGVSGLFAALHIPSNQKVLIITKKKVKDSDSYLAQGGICVLKDSTDYASFFEDTMKAGHYENRKESVDIMIRSSHSVIDELVDFGVDFAKDEQGNFLYTREGAHSKPRILFHEDITGEAITSKLLERVLERPNIEILEDTCMVDIIEKNNICYGLLTKQNGDYLAIEASHTILATGGIGGLFPASTNYPHLTADSVAVALKHRIPLEHPDYIQVHPTTFYSTKGGRSFLISESVRGEGAKLYDIHGRRFVNEVLPRDVVTKAILNQMKKDHSNHVWLDMSVLSKDEILNHFPHIYEHCMKEGIDVTKDWIPVIPAQHYYMGGVHVNRYSRTTMNNLYAVGETSCNGVHGHNRLASNSLLESLVFAKRAALHLVNEEQASTIEFKELASSSLSQLAEEYVYEYKKSILNEIKKRGGKKMNSISMSMNVDPLLKQALQEDITNEDITTNAVIRRAVYGSVQLICKENGIIAGLEIFERVFHIMDPKTEVTFFYQDGDAVENGDVLGTVRGDVRVLLSAERVALNYLQRMSGIATYTHQVASLLEGTHTRLLDTRKTTPNMRIFEKYAVTVGGGYNHRYNLSDGVLLKDNHIAAAGSVKKAVEMAKEYAPFVRKIEVEVENLDMVKEAVEAKADIIMLDNMSIEEMKEAVALIDGRALTECSGNVTKENVKELTSIGVDYISSGALTHSSPILDLSLKNLEVVE